MAEARECFICGENRPNSIETHHIVPRRYGGTDSPENLVDLCSSCHAAIEKLYTDDFYERLSIEKRSSNSDTDIYISGTTIPPSQTKDRDFPRSPVHVEVENFGYRLTVPQFYLHPVDDLIPDALPESDVLINKLEEIDLEIIKERDESKYKGGLVSVFPEDPRTTPPVEIVRETDTQGNVRIDDSPVMTGWFSRLHCGYCHTVYSQHEKADLAAHLRIKHRVEEPYRSEAEDKDMSL